MSEEDTLKVWGQVRKLEVPQEVADALNDALSSFVGGPGDARAQQTMQMEADRIMSHFVNAGAIPEGLRFLVSKLDHTGTATVTLESDRR